MQFNHDNMTGALLAADLVTLTGTEWSTLAAVATLTAHGIRRPDLTHDASEQLRLWSLTLAATFSADDIDHRCDTINALLVQGTAQAYLTTHDGRRPHLHFTAEQNDVVARVKSVTAGGLALFTVESEGTRLGVCQRDGCPVAFVDTSRNGLRAYCSATCGNYAAVRRHRARAGAPAR